MPNSLSDTLQAFENALGAFRAELALHDVGGLGVAPDGAEWLELLRYKLAPLLAGEACLIVAVCGGTNTGKSTVFNMLLEQDGSPVRMTAAATCRPVLAVSPEYKAQALAGNLLPGFDAVEMRDAQAALDHASPETQLNVLTVAALPAGVAFLDTPDVDSIDRENWGVAQFLRTGGDVLIAVLTGEKYKDRRVLEFFQKARAAGRVILPLMNKANPERNYEVARVQLADFVKDAGLPPDTPCFVSPYESAAHGNFSGKRGGITNVENGGTLAGYVASLDVAALKRQVYGESVRRFAEDLGEYLGGLDTVKGDLEKLLAEFEGRAVQFAKAYNPAPGAAVGGLFHEFVQGKRGPIGRGVGTVSEYTMRGITAAGRGVSRQLLPAYAAKRALRQDESAVEKAHRETISRISNDLLSAYVESARNLPAPMGALLMPGLERLDAESVAEAVMRMTIQGGGISEDFRAHAHRQMEDWWENHPMRRRALNSLDMLLMVSPVAIAGVMAVQTAGVGANEVALAMSPLMGKFAALAIEYQFGDALFKLLEPWREEQRAALATALKTELAGRVLAELREVLKVLDGNAVREMRRAHEDCISGVST